MTYEEKLLEVFSRFRGDGMDENTLMKMEEACEMEVWAHLPDEVRQSWQLHLGVSKGNHQEIELRPRQVGPASAERLEAALKEPFVLREPKKSKIADASIGFAMSFNVGEEEADQAEKEEPAAVTTVSTGSATAEPSTPSAPAKAASSAALEAELSAGAKHFARNIEAQAKELGVSLPERSALLQPFLDALAAAAEYKARAEAAEAKLETLLRQ